MSESLILEPQVMQGIGVEIRSPGCGGETGGILLGRRAGGEIHVADFEPVLCGRRLGPSYLLDEEDWQALDESVEWFRAQSDPELDVLGFYRSTTGPEFALDSQDVEWLQRHSQQDGSVFLLLRPGGGYEIAARVFAVRGGEPAAGEERAFPFEGAIALAEAPPKPEPPPEPVVPADPTPVEPPSGPAAESRRVAGLTTVWAAAVLVLTVAGAALGYHSGLRHPALASPPFDQGVRAALDEWSLALRSGDPARIAASYVPGGRIPPVTQRPAMVHISDLRIVPLSADRAVATLRKDWQFPGRPRRNEEERLVFDRIGRAWKIASEEPVRP